MSDISVISGPLIAAADVAALCGWPADQIGAYMVLGFPTAEQMTQDGALVVKIATDAPDPRMIVPVVRKVLGELEQLERTS